MVIHAPSLFVLWAVCFRTTRSQSIQSILDAKQRIFRRKSSRMTAMTLHMTNLNFCTRTVSRRLKAWKLLLSKTASQPKVKVYHSHQLVRQTTWCSRSKYLSLKMINTRHEYLSLSLKTSHCEMIWLSSRPIYHLSSHSTVITKMCESRMKHWITRYLRCRSWWLRTRPKSHPWKVISSIQLSYNPRLSRSSIE